MQIIHILEVCMSKFSDWMRKKLCKEHKKYTHKNYGRIYPPLYNMYYPFTDRQPDVYNEFGEKLETYFIRDIHYAHDPYRRSRYFQFDRYNFAVDTHFYTHETLLETYKGISTCKRRYGMFVESETIVPFTYNIFDENPGLEKDFDLIFTFSARLLDKLPNARFVPFCAAPFNAFKWQNGIFGVWDKIDDNYKYKTKNISIMSSDKLYCDLHKYRYDLACKCKNEKIADTFGTFDGGPFTSLGDTLIDYRYTFSIENDITPYFFTEKITSAFMTQTIPIYLGATEIDKFFNPNGIIKISVNDDIDDVIKQCTKEEYEKRLPAILDNYNRVQKYMNPFDIMYLEYLKT